MLTKSFKNVRLLMYLNIYIGYTVYYIGRQGFIFALPWIAKDMNISIAKIGIFISAFTFSYGVGKFLVGMIVDKFKNAGIVMGFGLLGVGAMNWLAGSASSYHLLVMISIMNGLFQSLGWPPCSKVLSNWFKNDERGKYWSFWSTSYAVGEAIAPWIINYFLITSGSWRYAMIRISTICLIFSVAISLMLKGSPEEVGFPAVNNNTKTSSVKSKGFFSVLSVVVRNKKIMLLSLAYFLVQFLRTAFSGWMALYIMSTYKMPEIASSCLTLFSVGGAVSLPFWGWLADITFKKNNTRLPLPILCLIALCIISFVWGMVSGVYYPIDMVASFLFGVMIFCPQMLSGIISVDIVGESVAGTVTGFIGMFAYLGSAFSGYPLGLVIEKLGWNLYFYILSAFCCIAAIIYVIILRMTERDKNKTF